MAIFRLSTTTKLFSLFTTVIQYTTNMTSTTYEYVHMVYWNYKHSKTFDGVEYYLDQDDAKKKMTSFPKGIRTSICSMRLDTPLRAPVTYLYAIAPIDNPIITVGVHTTLESAFRGIDDITPTGCYVSQLPTSYLVVTHKVIS